MNVVILGGGITGVLAAHQILKHSSFNAKEDSITLVEEYDIAAGASGKAGGFLAADWHGPATESLGVLSFRLHQELAQQYNGSATYDYARVKTISVNAKERKAASNAPERLPEANIALAGTAMRPLPPHTAHVHESWLDRVESQSAMSTHSTTAQIEPYKFTRTIFDQCRKLGLKYIRGKATSLDMDAGVLSSITVQTSPSCSDPTVYPSDSVKADLKIPTSHLIIACGPWSQKVVGDLLPDLTHKAPIGNLPGHSIILKTKPHQEQLAIFSSIRGPGSSRTYTGSPELFIRPNGLCYIAGENGQVQLPDSVTKVDALRKDALVEKLKLASAQLSTGLDVASGMDSVAVIKSQLCFRPTTVDGAPIIDWITKNIMLIAGAGPWGISLAPGTGQVVADLLLTGKATSASIQHLSADRF